MLKSRSITARYLALFLFGCFLFSYPVLTIFNLDKTLFGIPLFFLYFFFAWLVLNILIFFCGNIPDTFHLLEADTDRDDIN